MAATKHVIAVQVHYCVGNGPPQSVWIDVATCHGLSWTAQMPTGARPTNHGGGQPPRTNNPNTTTCPTEALIPGDGLCWWTGTNWSCG